ncbi:MAG: carbon monoxide dehydrogenase, partial [Chloroflexi bacterium]|nr:carbon monoxide dehydrogenase [Chloroflexota bacterium]
AALAEFGKQVGALVLTELAPTKRRELWSELDLTPRGIDREVVETLHRTHAGTDQDADHLLDQALRTSLTDGWGGSMLATQLADILFGTPQAASSVTDLGVLDPGSVNIVVHGHEPLLAEMLSVAAADETLLEKASAKGASGINLAGICCTANEALARRGISSVGGVTYQEKALLTRTVDVMAVDVQCVFQSLAGLAEATGTPLFTTSPKARITGVRHMPLEPDPLEAAKAIVRIAIDHYAPRPDVQAAPKQSLVAGFSLEYIERTLGGRFMPSLKPLNDAVVAGYIRGIAAVVGCNNLRVEQGSFSIVEDLIRNNVLVVQTGCMALDSARKELMWTEAFESAGPLLKEICKHIGIPPVLHVGSCVDNSRILMVLSRMVALGGLGEDISDLPVVGLAPEWTMEKALAIGAYFAASGVSVIFGHRSPVGASDEVTELMSSGWQTKIGGSLEFEPNPRTQAERAIDIIDEKREHLHITGFGLSSDERLGDKERKRRLIWWQKRLSNLLS